MATDAQTGRFLTAEWRYLVMLNFAVEPSVVEPLAPRGTEIDFWNGRTYVSVVGFRFERTCVLGMPALCYRNFDEVNLRFYVRRRHGNEWRRGVVFVKEIVPLRLIAWVARRFYNENYVRLPMRSVPMRDTIEPPAPGQPLGTVRYEWLVGNRWNAIAADIAGPPQPLAPGSEEEFITEHYWGYARQRDLGTVEYAVEHPPWRVWRAEQARLECDAEVLYGDCFAPVLCGQPTSAFVAEGSPVIVRRGRRLEV